MQQKALSLMQFQKKFGTEKACQNHLFRLRWPEGDFAVPAANMLGLMCNAPDTYTIVRPAAIKPL
jgi:hypothetical protein